VLRDICVARRSTAPQVSLEFDVADADAVHGAADELVADGYEVLHPVREEPWGQTVVRLQSPEGPIIGVSHAPHCTSDGAAQRGVPDVRVNRQPGSRVSSRSSPAWIWPSIRVSAAC